MRLTVQLCAAVAAAIGVVVVAVEQVEPREALRADNRRDVVYPLRPEESSTPVGSRRLSSETRRRQWARQNIYPRHYTQEEPGRSVIYWANQRLMGRYHSPGERGETTNLQTVAAARHESRAPQPMRIDSTGLPIVRDSANDPSPVSRTRTTEDERFSSSEHQVDLQASTNSRRRLPHTRNFDDARVHPISRDGLQRPEIHSRVSYDDAWMAHTSSVVGRGEQVDSTSLAASSKPVERPAHHRHRLPNTHSSSGFTKEPSTAITRGSPREPDAAEERLRTQHSFSKISDEVDNDVQQQRLHQPDRCCGSRVPFDPRAARPTGAFQRVASAGSIKVVRLPDPSSFPPNAVRDLRAAPLNPHTLSLTWTAPGDDLDSGTASGYIIRLSEALHDLQGSQFDAAPEETLLETSETLTASGVYQTAGTPVGVEVPLVRHLQRGHIYYVALKALDSDGYSSGVSNVARFTIPESSMDNNVDASHNMTTANHTGADPQVEEALSTSSSLGSVHRNREVTVRAFSERGLEPPVRRGSDTASEPQAVLSEEQSVLSTPPTSISDPSESEGSENQRKRRKGRKKKNKKSKRRRKDGRRSGRRKGGRQRGENSDTSVWKSHVLDIYAELDKWNES